MSSTSRVLRFTSILLILALTWTDLAHATKSSHKLPPQAQGPQSPVAPTAQSVAPAPGISVADRMLAAHTVYVTAPTVDPYFAVSPTVAYDVVLNAVNQWGRYRVVTDANQADLVLQIHGQVTSYSTSGTPPDYTPDVYYTSTLQVTVADPHTLAPLWVVAAPLTWRPGNKLHTTTIAVSGNNVISDLKQVVGDPLTAQDKSDLKIAQIAVQDAKKKLIIIGAVGVGAVIAGAIVGIHLVHSNAQSFCQQHNLSPCPGS